MGAIFRKTNRHRLLHSCRGSSLKKTRTKAEKRRASSPVIRYYQRRRALRSKRKPTCIDLFAGAGGLAEGFRQAGFAIVSGVDADPYARDTFVANFPQASFFECDIRHLDGEHLLRDAGLKRGQLDCLIGGPPCQSFSYNNHQRSASHARSRLFHDYLRIVETLQPKTIVMENVPGILTIGKGKVVQTIIKELDKLGYDCKARILFAEDFGVPQERRRVFFIGTRRRWEESLFPKGSCGPAKKPSAEVNPWVHQWTPSRGSSVKDFATVWDAISDLPRLSNGASRNSRRHLNKPKTSYQRAARAESGDVLKNHITRDVSRQVLRRIADVPAGGNWRDIPRQNLTKGMRRARLSDHTKRYGRPRRRDLSCTILTKCDPHWGAYIHPTQDRVISVREAARLQSFGDHFVFGGAIDAQYTQVGNAVPPLMAKAIARGIKHHVRKRRRRPHLKLIKRPKTATKRVHKNILGLAKRSGKSGKPLRKAA